MSWGDYYYPPSRPRKVDGGIKARGARGSIGESWWARRFVDVIESFALGSRMTRGRSYARAGQVISLDVTPGVVTAQVQGSRARPYTVTIGLKPFLTTVWKRIEVTLAGQALYSARLLAGEMPQEIEEVFTSAGVSLFPSSVRELTMRCSCPDSAVPCKHLAATFYLLAEAFDADPFQILYWRGKPKEELLSRLRELRSSTGDEDVARPQAGARAGDAATGASAGASVGATPGVGAPAAARSDTRPVGAALALADVVVAAPEDSVGRFWVSPQPLPQHPHAMETEPDLLLRQLPAPSKRIGGARLIDRLRPAYDRFPPDHDKDGD